MIEMIEMKAAICWLHGNPVQSTSGLTRAKKSLRIRYAAHA
jgi:hypothetical protein